MTKEEACRYIDNLKWLNGYNNTTIDGKTVGEILDEIKTLLKEQEAVEPINSHGTLRCGNCNNIVGYNDGNGRGYQNNYCSCCGRLVKLE